MRQVYTPMQRLMNDLADTIVELEEAHATQAQEKEDLQYIILALEVDLTCERANIVDAICKLIQFIVTVPTISSAPSS